MKTRLLIIIGIIVCLAIVMPAMLGNHIQILYQERSLQTSYENSPTMDELMEMSCDNILKENIKGIKFYTEKGMGDLINEKVVECLKQEIP